MKLVAGNSNLPLAQSIATFLGLGLTECTVRRFADGEIFVDLEENVRGRDVFVIQSTCFPANDHVMELLILTDALKRASARRITAVIPYFGYARQDRKTSSRAPITAKLLANLITRAGADRVLTLDLHAGQIQGFFDIPTDNLFGNPLFTRDVKQTLANEENIAIVSPDIGGTLRARQMATQLDATLAIIDKRRPRPNQSEVMNIIGEVKDHACLLIDDIVDSAGTLANASQALLNAGASSVRAYATHAVLSNGAVKKIEGSGMKELVVTDSIPLREGQGKDHPLVRIIPLAPLLGEAMRRTNREESVSSLFEEPDS